LSENVAVDGGRGIFSDVGGTLTVDDSTLSGNNAFLPGGAIWSTSKTLTVRNPEISKVNGSATSERNRPGSSPHPEVKGDRH
jgi:hypothetical protein